MLKFKTSELEEQFYDYKKTDARIRAIIRELAWYLEKLFKKEMVITCVHRTEHEQIKLYPKFFQKYGKPKPSGHTEKPCRAVDVRAKNLDIAEITELKNYFDFWYDSGDWFSFIHEAVGKPQEHIHIQVAKMSGVKF